MSEVPAWELDTDPGMIAQHVAVFRPHVLSHLKGPPGPTDRSPIDKLERVYAAFDSHPIGYDDGDVNSENGTQIVRTPHQVLGRPGSGTCLDLAVMFSAACVHAGLNAAIIVLDRQNKAVRNRHAVVAVAVGNQDDELLASRVWDSRPQSMESLVIDLAGPPTDWAIVDVVGVAATGENTHTDMVGLGVEFAASLASGAKYLDDPDWEWSFGINVTFEPAELFDWTPDAEADHPIGPKQHVGAVALPGRRPTITDTSSSRLVGRDSQLTKLRDTLQDDTAEVAVVSGLGGIGKSALAIEYAYRYGQNYSLIWWADAENLNASYRSLADVLRIKCEPDQLETEIVGHLRQRNNWLCVLDNAEGPATVTDYRRSIPTGKVIATSRADAAWSDFAVLNLKKIEDADAKAWLLAVAEESDLDLTEDDRPTEDSAADQLVELLDGLALALSMATAYIRFNGISLAEYLTRYNRRAEMLLSKERYLDPEDNDFDRTVYRTWNVSITDLAERDCADAIKLLETICFYAPNRIPLWIFTEELFGTSPEELDEAVNDLRDFSLVEKQGDFISLHRLVQDVTRFSLQHYDGAQQPTADVLQPNAKKS